jgi:hypothetical protein
MKGAETGQKPSTQESEAFPSNQKVFSEVCVFTIFLSARKQNPDREPGFYNKIWPGVLVPRANNLAPLVKPVGEQALDTDAMTTMIKKHSINLGIRVEL